MKFINRDRVWFRAVGRSLAPVSLVLALVLPLNARSEVIPGSTDMPKPEAVANALQMLKQLTTVQNFAKMGFQSYDEVAHAEFGIPIRVYNVPGSSMSHYQPADDPSTIIQQRRSWIYPVQVNKGEVRCLVQLAWRVDAGGVGAWKAISYGSQGLARALFSARAREAASMNPPREELFFLLGYLEHSILGIRTDGNDPISVPGRHVVRLTWLSLPPTGHSQSEWAEDVFSYFSSGTP